MEREWKIIIFAAAFVLVAVAVSFFINKAYFAPVTLEECKVLSYNGEGKPSIVIFSDEGTAKEYEDYFFSVSPFDKNKNKFNFYYIDSYIPSCSTYKEVALLCYSKELLKKASSCPNDYIIVVDKSSDLRSSAYMNVMSLNYNSPLSVFIHEFGHAFGNLADEYTPSSVPRGSGNCVSDCESFGSGAEGCFEGCSKNSLYRSINLGVMRTLSSSVYGPFDEQIILSKIRGESGITGSAVLAERDCSRESYILLEGIYSNGKVDVVSESVEGGCIGGNGAGGFDFSIRKEDGSLINGGEFNPELVFTDSFDSGEAFESGQPFLLRVPIIDNARTLEISSQGELITGIDLTKVGARPCRV